LIVYQAGATLLGGESIMKGSYALHIDNTVALGNLGCDI
jgi:hypothetical protein